VPAHRKYSDAQRGELYRLFAAGVQPKEIARRCAEGTTGVEPFQIPRRTVHQIVTGMAKEAEQEVPSSLSDVEDDPAAAGRFPLRTLRILDAELDRLEKKQGKYGLIVSDLEKLAKITQLSAAVQKRIQNLSHTEIAVRRRRRTERRSESLIERLAKDLQREAQESEPPEPAQDEPSLSGDGAIPGRARALPGRSRFC
jgi:hypothetical protein